ncbi:hypothetical protein [Bradyrhizobium sp.]|uniref:hypothetical protein n=1 Tax=Bradyrhizobium sp. TaxID=376 RepID=UPI0039E4E074
MLKLRNYPGGRPAADDESNLEYRPEHLGYPVFVVWIADDVQGNAVKVSIGFPFIMSSRINAALLNNRAELEAAANVAYTPGATEVGVFAQYGEAAA